MKFRVLAAAVITSALFLGGCGSGDGGGIYSSPLKGYWEDLGGLTKAIVLANGDGWFVFKNDQNSAITSCARVQMTEGSGLSFSASGKQYLLQTGAASDVTGSGTYIQKASLTGSLLTQTFTNLVYDSSFEKTAVQADVGGTWIGNYGTYNNGTAEVANILTLTVNDVTGIVAGSSTNACNYSGSAHPRASDPALFDITLDQSCVDNTSRHLSGIAYTTQKVSDIYLSVATTTADRSSAALFIGKKQLLQ